MLVLVPRHAQVARVAVEDDAVDALDVGTDDPSQRLDDARVRHSLGDVGRNLVRVVDVEDAGERLFVGSLGGKRLQPVDLAALAAADGRDLGPPRHDLVHRQDIADDVALAQIAFPDFVAPLAHRPIPRLA